MRANSVDAVDAWLAAAAQEARSSLVEIVLRSDDAEDLTLREARLLGSADVLAHEADVPTIILDRARADAIRMPADGPVQVTGLTVILRRRSADQGSPN